MLAAALTTWATLHGLVSLEIFGHLQPIVGDPADAYRASVRATLRHLGLDIDTRHA